MIGKVEVWYMTEEERQDYIKKHPIKPQEHKKIDKNFAKIGVDYKWRGKKAAEAKKAQRLAIQ
ncbi:hypothetical protein [Cytobacillus praedii]|uniref:Uncharacterized protein n=1 Tax=Cytobacillus praedii TaxID=1742358 RepID=A0A4R1AYL2_9BACI|nr:hypothetical protein [Cytobacillus praedii]TCJ05058.1 hypothetical protein E0Y62_07530 [Cytobacillus praedii]